MSANPLAHDLIRDGMARIRADRRKATELDPIKRKLGLDETATFKEVSGVIDDLIDVAAMYERLSR